MRAEYNRNTFIAGVVAGVNDTAQNEVVDLLIAKIKSDDDKVRTEGWLGAGEVGATAVKPLARVMLDKELEVARAAKRALWKIVRHVGQSGSDNEKKAVVAEMIGLLNNDHSTSIRREVLWMLSEIGSRKVIKPIAVLLSNRELREDARMVLERIPQKMAIRALKTGLEAVPDDFKLNIAQSLRKRGVDVPGLACVKLVPAKKTSVKSVKEGVDMHGRGES